VLHKLVEQLAEYSFPFLSMGRHPIAILFKSEQVCDLVQQGHQESIRIEIAIDTDAVILLMGAVTVIAQYTFPFPGDGEMYFVFMQVLQSRLPGTGGEELCGLMFGNLFFRRVGLASVL